MHQCHIRPTARPVLQNSPSGNAGRSYKIHIEVLVLRGFVRCAVPGTAVAGKGSSRGISEEGGV